MIPPKKTATEPTLLDLNKISRNTVFKGEISSEGDFRIDGTFEGTIDTKGRIVVGTNGSVKGDIHCSNAEIEGHVDGIVTVQETLSLKSTGSITGEVCASRLAIEMGGVFDVACKMKK